MPISRIYKSEWSEINTNISESVEATAGQSATPTSEPISPTATPTSEPISPTATPTTVPLSPTPEVITLPAGEAIKYARYLYNETVSYGVLRDEDTLWRVRLASEEKFEDQRQFLWSFFNLSMAIEMSLISRLNAVTSDTAPW